MEQKYLPVEWHEGRLTFVSHRGPRVIGTLPPRTKDMEKEKGKLEEELGIITADTLINRLDT